MKMNEDRNNPYADIMDLPHHQSATRPHMSMLNRAAQFSPYAALVGFDGVIAETGRLTDRKVELSETEKVLMDQKLTLISDAIHNGRHPTVTVSFFVKDPLKEGGAYEEYTGPVRKIDPVARAIVFLAANGRSSGKAVPVDDIRDLRGDLVDDMDDYGYE